jgi:prepilin-type processing-associated H-X9-DG protein
MQCGNNVKQMSLAIQNYHDTFMYTPYGVRERTTLNASTGAVTGRNWGPSWLFATLPYCEQKPLYDKMDAQDRAATGNDYRTNNNVALQANNAKIKYMLCPSSPLPETDSVSGRIFTRNSYVGISGAFVGNSGGLYGTAPNTFTDGRYANSVNNGRISGGGMLTINEALTFAACIDGTAFQIVVGEVSDWFYSGTAPNFTTRNRVDGSSGGYWFSGTNSISKAPVNGTGTSNVVVYNITTIYMASPTNEVKQNDNNRNGTNNTLNNRGVINASGTALANRGANSPLLSAHPNGSMVGYLDGHVELLTRQTAQYIIGRLATRDDGGVINAN